MIIGLDFDNTIACYDQAIAHLSKEMFSLPADVPATKLGVRDYLHAAGREPEWTEFQAYLYGPGMAHAVPFPGTIEAIAALQGLGHRTLIISHRTKYPYLGPRFDLHQSARTWMAEKLIHSGRSLFAEADIYLNESRDDKIGLIGTLGCDVFLDDLPDVLGDKHFPVATRKLLFSDKADASGVTHIKHWNELQWHCAQ